jgi:hypothetical protein
MRPWLRVGDLLINPGHIVEVAFDQEEKPAGPRCTVILLSTGTRLSFVEGSWEAIAVREFFDESPG